jgi:hypothetical protein
VNLWHRLTRRYFWHLPLPLPPFGTIDLVVAWTPIESALLALLVVGMATGVI